MYIHIYIYINSYICKYVPCLPDHHHPRNILSGNQTRLVWTPPANKTSICWFINRFPWLARPFSSIKFYGTKPPSYIMKKWLFLWDFPWIFKISPWISPFFPGFQVIATSYGPTAFGSASAWPVLGAGPCRCHDLRRPGSSVAMDGSRTGLVINMYTIQY